jgi:hypothetical protein
MANSVPEESGKRWNIEGVSDEEQAEIIAALQRATQIEKNVQERNKEKGKEEDKTEPDLSALNAVSFGNEPPDESDETQDESDEEQSLGYHSLTEFERLCRLGYEEDTVEIAGNRISLRTLSQGEELEALNRANRYNPAAQGQAFSCYVLAQALQAVNGKNWFKRIPMTATDDVLDEKFHEILRINPYITDRMITAYRKLEKDINEKASYAGKG